MRYVGPRQIVIDGEPTPCPHWTPTQDLAGKTVAIIGSGPQLATFDLNAVRGKPFIVTNSGCRRLRQIATDSDILYFTDNAWNENRPELAAGWPGPVITANRNVKARLGDKVRYIDVTALTLRMAVRADYAQASSGHIAACLAADMGAKKLVLIGFECTTVDGVSHGHKDYTQSDPLIYTNRFLPGWEMLAPAFERRGVEVVNVTPHSAIEWYRRGDLAEEMAGG